MNKLQFFIIILLPLFNVFGQEDFTEQELDSILNLNQAERFLETHPQKGNEIITFNEENHQTNMVRDLFSRGRVTIESGTYNTHYKVVERNSIPHYRASYIYLDGSKMNDSEINTTRNRIIEKFKEGTPFSQLALQYSMDKNAKKGGDLGWFTKGTYYPEFEYVITSGNHQLNDIFTLDIDEKNWHYVILITYDVKEIREVKALKIVTPKN
ncbi:peptidylprolyl isomerase [Hanstruepera marina]|uniref:peptidylprolyl isomerase n=1 Tax=Hanstruepera marina TaxID=2873265 RepID=UPI001CA7A17C|nr:peptidylprolyl isomerase [Hanstruepera marina]